MRRWHLMLTTALAAKRAMRICKKELRGSEDMKSKIRSEVAMAIESETLRVKQRNLERLTFRRQLMKLDVISVAFFAVVDN